MSENIESIKSAIGMIESVAILKIDALKSENRRLRQTLELIRDHGGCLQDETGMTCTGGWCAEQARRTLEG